MLSTLHPMMKRFGYAGLALFFFSVAAVALGAALVSQYGFNLAPCVLCIYQRYPYVILMAVAALLFFLRHSKHRDALVYLAVLLLIIGAGIAFFHVGVEQKWWQGTRECGSGMQADSIEALRQKILNAVIVRCDEPAFVLLGISMAGWNVLYSLGAAAAGIYYLRSLQYAKKSNAKKANVKKVQDKKSGGKKRTS